MSPVATSSTALEHWRRITAAITTGAPVPGSVSGLKNGGAIISYYRNCGGAVESAAAMVRALGLDAAPTYEQYDGYYSVCWDSGFAPDNWWRVYAYVDGKIPDLPADGAV